MVQTSVWPVFSDSCVDLTEVAGRHGIEIADQVSCAAGWNPLSSSGRHRFWHIHCTLTPKLIIYRFPVAVQQWLSIPIVLICLCNHVSGRLESCDCEWYAQHMQKRYFLLDTSMIPGSWTLVTLQALLDEPRGLLKHVVGSENFSWRNLIKCIVHYVVSPSSDTKNPFFLNRCGAKFCQTCEILDGCHERSLCSE